MALDKLVNSTVLDAALRYTANRIRAKTDGSESLPFDMSEENPKGFGDSVDDIQSGGITPSGSLNITENGTYDVTQKASAVVNVPQGITPTGTKQISILQNGTTTEDVTSYASAEIMVNVPNSYAAGDEGKVVSNGALVAQTSDSVTVNGTVDTTLINSLTVNVPSGGGIDRGSFTPAEKSNTVGLQVSREITGLMILAETNPYTGTGHRTSAGLLYDTNGGVRANAMLTSNASGNSGIVSMSATAFSVTQNGNVVTVVSEPSYQGYFAAGVTYRWIAW